MARRKSRPWLVGQPLRRAPRAAVLRASLLAAVLASGAGLSGCEEGPAPQGPGRVATADLPEPPVLEFSPAPLGAARLTRTQYTNAVRALLGPVVVPQSLESDVSQAGFLVVGAGRTAISPRGVEQYEEAAYDVAQQAVADRGFRALFVPCTPSGATDAACFRETLEALGRRAWRRDLTEGELNDLVALAVDAGGTLGDFFAGLEFGIARLLQSPYFLMRVETGEPAPEHPGQLQLTGVELASRLSFFLWNAPPDTELLAAGTSGELLTDAGLSAQTERLLSDGRARLALRNFFTEHMALSGLDDLIKDPYTYAHTSPAFGPAAKEETLRLLDHLIFDLDADFRSVLTTRTTYIDRRLAALYQVPAPSLEGFARVELPENGPRAGLLGHASLLALNSHATASSATRRGQFIRKVLLCDVIPPPPANVDTSLPEANPDAPTLRDRLAPHRKNEPCKSCHSLMDPIGLALEQFDGMGEWRTLEAGTLIDPSGELDGVAFTTAREMSQVLAQSEKIGPCLTRKMYRYATAHEEVLSEDALLAQLADDFAAGGYRVQTLMRAVVMSPGFRRGLPPSDEDPEGDAMVAGAEEESR